jgi:hypothetical protein
MDTPKCINCERTVHLVKLATLDENRKMKTVKKTIRIQRGKKEYGLAITDRFVTSPLGSRLGCIQYWRNCPRTNSGVFE